MPLSGTHTVGENGHTTDHNLIDAFIADVPSTYGRKGNDAGYEAITMLVYGHSGVIFPGTGCTAGAEWPNRVRERLRMMGIGNYAAGGSRQLDVTYDIQGSTTNSVAGATWVNTRRGFVLLDAMGNDAINLPDQTANPTPVALTAQQVTNYQQALTTALAHLTAESRVDSSTGTTTGTWTTASSSIYNGGSLLRSSVQNSTVDITVTVPASGIVWAISYSIAGLTNGDMEIRDVTGGANTLLTTVTGTSQAATAIWSRRTGSSQITFPYPIKLSGLTPGSRVLRFKKTDAAALQIYIDVLLPAAAEPVPVAVVKDYTFSNSGVSAITTDPGYSIVNANTALLKPAVDTAVADFPSAFAVDLTGSVSPLASVEDFYPTDGIHLSDRGMRKVADVAGPLIVKGLRAHDTDGLYVLTQGNPATDAYTFTLPASTVATNIPRDSTLYVSGGTVTAVTIDGTATGLTSGAFTVRSGHTFAVTYSVAPTVKAFAV